MQYRPSVATVAQHNFNLEKNQFKAGMWKDKSASRQTAQKERGTEQETHVQMYGGHTEENQKSRKPY